MKILKIKTKIIFLLFFLGSLLVFGVGRAEAKFINTAFYRYANITASDIPKLAKYDILDMNRRLYPTIGGNSWVAIKAINPNAEIYVYEDGTHIYSTKEDNLATIYLSTIARYSNARSHSMGNLNTDNPDLFLLDGSGDRVINSEYGDYLLDFGNPKYQQYWSEAVNTDIITQAWNADGIFIDDCVSFYSGENQVKYNTTVKWASAMQDFTSAINFQLHNSGEKSFFNVGGTNTTNGYNYWRNMDNSSNHPDIAMEEGAFATGWTSNSVGFYSESGWKNQIDTLNSLQNIKGVFASATKLSPGAIGTDNFGKPVDYWQIFYFALSSYLLGKNDVQNTAYFLFNDDYGVSYDIPWFDEYDKLDLGSAVGNYQMTSFGTDIYYREFQKGYIYVNPTNTDSSTITLPQTGKQLTHDNLASDPATLSDITTFILTAHHGTIILKDSAISDTIPPAAPTGLSVN